MKLEYADQFRGGTGVTPEFLSRIKQLLDLLHEKAVPCDRCDLRRAIGVSGGKVLCRTCGDDLQMERSVKLQKEFVQRSRGRR